MSMLHSFYCWGQVATVLISTLLLFALGDAAWRVLPLLWMAMPIASVVLISTAPFAAESGAESGGMRVRDLLRQPLFLVAMVIMTCAGASELTMSQWASTFAERGLHVTKVLGDLLGPCLFAVFMGLGAHALRQARKPPAAEEEPDGLRDPVHRLLPHGGALAGAVPRADGLRGVRVLRVADVAGLALDGGRRASPLGARRCSPSSP